MKKVLRIMALCLLLVMSFTIIASAEEVQPKSSGYQVYNLKHLGKNYTVRISAAYTIPNGATVTISSEATIWVRMNDLQASFKTREHGRIIEVGGRQYNSVRLNNPELPAHLRVSGQSTYPVRCRYGDDQVRGEPSITGSGDVETLVSEGVKNPPRRLTL